MTTESTACNTISQYSEYLSDSVLRLLIKDRSSGQNLIWATDTYAWRGKGYGKRDQITTQAILGEYGTIIRPRIKKTEAEKQQRIKNRAEVFTPSWVCNKQNNLIDNDWFSKKGVFNTETHQGWITRSEKVTFSDEHEKSWQDYIKSARLEIACGEAPYLTSRYDAVSGEAIDFKNRIGLFDRKLRVVSENVDSEPEWVNWALFAVKAIYGFDFQGDNVVIARENLLFSFLDAYIDKFEVPPLKCYAQRVAAVLAWNIWQMDGFKYVIPYSCCKAKHVQLSMFEDKFTELKCPGCQLRDNTQHIGIYCKVMNWSRQHSETFISQLGRTRK